MIACISISLKLAIKIQCKFLNCLLTSELLLRSGYNYCEIGRQGIEQLGSPFGCIALLFPLKVAGDRAHSSTGKSLASTPK